MSEQNPQAPETDTPAPNAPDTATEAVTEAPAIDYEKRYSDLRPEYDRANQELAQYRSLYTDLQSDDQDTRLQAAQALGLEFVTDDQDQQEPLDPLEELRAELAQLKNGLSERDQQTAQDRQLAEMEQNVNTQLDAIPGLDETDRDWVLYRALNMPVTSDGLPDITGAHEALVARDEAARSRWADTKSAPSVPAVGQQATHAPDLADEATRQAWMLERASRMNT